ncbi:MAG: methyltransferase domain-containing protein [Anaerolineales bacterium]|nr:methyltransferase domain-containing protein [Anaerolineales bacterium]
MNDVKNQMNGNKLTMNPILLDWICCPRCNGTLRASDHNDILVCNNCGADYQVVYGVPILLADVSDCEKLIAKNFAEQWELFHRQGGLGEEFEEKQFYDYFYPYDTNLLKGQTVLEAGCGYGRNLIQAKKCGAKIAIGFDIGPAALIAKEKGMDVVIADNLNPPFRKKFDMVFTFGVLQHVSNPDAGIEKLSELVKDGGMFCHSVYAAENNQFLERYLTPLRIKIFQHWPSQAKYILSLILGCLSYIFFFCLYKPFSLNSKSNAWASDHLFYYDYMILTINKLGLKQWIGQIYDHLGAPLAAYFTRHQVEKWVDELGLKNTYYYFRNRNTHNFGGQK